MFSLKNSYRLGRSYNELSLLQQCKTLLAVATFFFGAENLFAEEVNSVVGKEGHCNRG